MNATSATGTGLPDIKKHLDSVQYDAIILASVLEGIEALLEDRTATNAVGGLVKVSLDLANKISHNLDRTVMPGGAA